MNPTMRYSDEEKSEAVGFVRDLGLAEARRRTGVAASVLRRWATDAGVDAGTLRDDAGGLSGPEAARLVGMTYRRLDRLVAAGVVSPSVESSGTGHPRRFDDDDVRTLRDIVALTEHGFVASALHGHDRATIRRLRQAVDAALADD